jgi:hypothetical protein
MVMKMQLLMMMVMMPWPPVICVVHIPSGGEVSGIFGGFE